jgi:flagellar biosynthesis protein FliP
VLSLLRHALGTQTSPPNQVLVGLALFLTFFIMAPVGDKIYSDEANKAWSTEYGALRESPEAKEMERNEVEFVKSLRPYLTSTRGSGDQSFDLAQSHGHVWLYLRK